MQNSDGVMLDMWEKWTGLAATAGSTCLMRANIGDIVATPGGQVGDPPVFSTNASRWRKRPASRRERPSVEACVTNFFSAGSSVKASMLRDIERGAPTEGEHVLGDLRGRARAYGIATPVLDLAHCHVAAYEIERARRLSGS